ncbi:MAG: hypothetical protein A2X36_01065 [Elusimicrobia bacterium GWA2_69_24]|nr:MAG: hypothetical protein A2X36_01065 [Elusimicrobia bacterium GWA2_69_24]HBL17250.1 hypothetical protein [Elusimicrobiota bacterium]
MTLSILARARLVRVSDGKQLLARSYFCASPGAKHGEWAAAGAAKFKAELESCYQRLVQDMMRDAYQLDTPSAPTG